MLRRLIERIFKIKIIIKNERRSNMKENKNTVLPCYDNRELSWLKFNERVLEEAEDERVPLCERLTFVNIFSTNFWQEKREQNLHDLQWTIRKYL